jgi:hypothetical protein
MREHHAKSGRLIYYATRPELEALPGFRPEAGGRRGRACCPIHGGDNPTALSIDWQSGWARCWSCGDAFSIRVEDEGGQRDDSPPYAPSRPGNSPSRDFSPPKAPDTTPAPPAGLRAALVAAITAAVERLPSSPGAAYLAGRGIPLDTARALQLGWSTSGKLAGRVVFPLTDPAGIPTSALGRAITDTTRPKYDTLPAAKGYQKTMFNGGAVALARQAGAPLILVEGPLDAAACVAAGLPLAAAICGASYRHPEHFAGLATVILALDTDPAGQAGRQALWLALVAHGIEVLLLPAAALDGCKDLAEYWQRHGRMPEQLAARMMGQRSTPPSPPRPRRGPSRRDHPGLPPLPLAGADAVGGPVARAEGDGGGQPLLPLPR